MNWKRIISALVLFSLLVIFMVHTNQQIFDVVVSIVAIMCLHEFYKAFRNKAKPIEWIGYIAAGLIAIIHYIPSELFLPIIGAIIPVSLMVLFIRVIISDGELNIIDASITLFGIAYIVLFLLYGSLIRGNLENGKYLIWFVFLASWGTDVMAYFVGKAVGKHHFSKVSPKKTVEGCLGGICGGVIAVFVFTYMCNTIWGLDFNYLNSIIVALLFSFLSQVGDLSASCIKRYCGVKDYSNLIPGHGGMLDRIDSVIFVLPFAYFLLSIL